MMLATYLSHSPLSAKEGLPDAAYGRANRSRRRRQVRGTLVLSLTVSFPFLAAPKVIIARPSSIVIFDFLFPLLFFCLHPHAVFFDLVIFD